MGLYAVADFCLIPMGITEAGRTVSVGIYIAECQRVLETYKAKGISYEMHGYGTNLEGPFALVSEAVEQCHIAVHAKGIPRISTDIRIGTRIDKAPPTVKCPPAEDLKEKHEDRGTVLQQTGEAEPPLSYPTLSLGETEDAVKEPFNRGHHDGETPEEDSKNLLDDTEALRKQDEEKWAKGLTENQRKKESARRWFSHFQTTERKTPLTLSSDPLYAVADFCLLPMGTPTNSVGYFIGECQRTLDSLESEGIRYELHGYGTNLEGKFEDVWKAIERCHRAVHNLGIPRIATDIRIGTRIDKKAPTFEADGQREKKEGVNEDDTEDWTRGLTENQRKAESVRRIMRRAEVNKT